MIRVVLLLLTGMGFYYSCGQSSSQKIDTMLDQAKAVFKVNSDSARNLEENALSLAKKSGYTAGEVRAYFYLGYYHQYISKDYEYALRNYINSIHTSEPDHDSLSLGWVLYSNLNSSIILGNFGLTESSIDFLQKAREIAIDINNEHELNKVDFWIYRRQADQGHYLEGLAILNEIIQRAPLGSDQYLNALNSIGVCNSYLGNFELAKTTYESVISTSQEFGKTEYEDYAFHNLGDLLIKNERWHEAEKILEYVLETKIIRRSETKRDGNLLGTYKDLLLTKLKVGKPEFVLSIQKDIEALIPDVRSRNPDYYFTIYPLMSRAFSDLGENSLSKHYADAFQRDSLAHFQTQSALNYETRRLKLEAVVSAYYADLNQERQQIRSRNLLLSAIVGLSFLLLALLAYHFISKYRVRKMLAQSLEQLNWDD